MEKRVQRYILIFVGIIVTGCGNSGEKASNAPVTESENLNVILNEARFQWIDLNNVFIDTIVVPKEDIYEEKLFVSDSLYVTSPTHMTVFDGNMVVNEFGKANVVIVNKEGELQRNLSREGRGPGEFERPLGLMTDGTHLYIYDDAQKRVSVFDKEFELLNTFDLKDVAPGDFSKTIVMNNELIAYQIFSASSLYSEETEGGMLQIRLKNQPDSVHFSALPRIVPRGMQPGAYNNLLIALNNKNNLAVAFSGLPYLIVYEELQHQLTIGLKATHYDTTDTPSLKPTAIKGNTGVGVKSVINNVKLMDNGDILFFSFGLIHHLVKKESGNYTAKKSYQLIREGSGDKLIAQEFVAMPEEPTMFYVLGWRNLYKVDIPIFD